MAAACLCLALAAACPVPALADPLPQGFSRLADVAPTIREDMRYAGPDNFVGRPLTGYQAPACILRTEAARALARVQARLAKEGLGLVVFDCYRPMRAVADILAWANAGQAPRLAPHHPDIDRHGLVALGYIAAQSTHSTGYAVDLGLTRPGEAAKPATPRVACTAPVRQRGDEGTLDFGTAFDCFDPRSSTRAGGLPAEAAAHRWKLLQATQAEGFANYPREWWHFTYEKRGEDHLQDFPVTAP